MRLLLLLLSFIGLYYFSPNTLYSQKIPEASPFISVRQDFSTSFIQLEYSRPSVRGRKIFGGLISYDKLWRAGANLATKLTFGEDVIFADNKLSQGTYVLYIIPSKKQWTVILNKGLQNWGLSGYMAEMDILRVNLPLINLVNLQETFEISVENITKNSCQLVIKWENSMIAIPIKSENEKLIENMVYKLSHSDHPPYLVLARYFLANKKNLDQALEYVQIELNKNPKAFHIEALKAEILLQLGKKDEAIKSAELFLEESKGTSYEQEYKLRYNKIIETFNNNPGTINNKK